MTKQETQILKGWAICSMLFMHLFDNVTLVSSECSYLFSIGDYPLVSVIARIMNPVPYFMILSGYGMYKVNKRPEGDTNRFRRLIKVLVHYWFILLVFVFIGYLTGQRNTIDINELVANLLVWDVSLCPVNWFLFPYLVLALFSNVIIPFYDKIRCRYLLVVTFLINFCTSYLISRFGASFLFNNLWVYNPLLCLHLLFAYTIGYSAARCNLFRNLFISRNISMFLLLALCILRSLVDTSIIHNEFVFLFIILFLNSYHFRWIDNILSFLGLHSMNIWFIHAWFYLLLFHNFIYSFKCPILIYLVLLGMSTFCSYLVNMVLKPVEKIYSYDRSKIACHNSIKRT